MVVVDVVARLVVVCLFLQKEILHPHKYRMDAARYTKTTDQLVHVLNFPYVMKEEPSQSVTLGLTYTRMSVKTVIVVSFLLNIKLDSDHVRASW